MPQCPNCGYDELDTEQTNDALAHDENFDYFCVNCGELFAEDDV